MRRRLRMARASRSTGFVASSVCGLYGSDQSTSGPFLAHLLGSMSSVRGHVGELIWKRAVVLLS